MSFRLEIQWPREAHEVLLLPGLGSAFENTLTDRNDKNYVPVIVGRLLRDEGVYEKSYMLCNSTKLKTWIGELNGWSASGARL